MAAPEVAARRRRPALLGVLAVIAVAAVVGIVSATHHRPHGFDPHAMGTINGAKLNRLLRATAAAADSSAPDALAEEGRQLFFSTEVAQHGLSCATCHTAGGGVNPQLGTQNHPTKGGDFTGARDPISLWGVADTAPYLWTGAVPTLPEQTVRVITNFFKAGATQPASVTAHQAAALDAYLATLDPPTSPFDLGTMSAAAQNGERLFRGKAGCVSCHFGPLFTDNLIHVTGVPKSSGDTDPGSASVPGGFNTPQLRDIGATAPYMHNGSIPTLLDVVNFYDQNVVLGPLHLKPAEIADLVAYLEAL